MEREYVRIRERWCGVEEAGEKGGEECDSRRLVDVRWE